MTKRVDLKKEMKNRKNMAMTMVMVAAVTKFGAVARILWREDLGKNRGRLVDTYRS